MVNMTYFLYMISIYSLVVANIYILEKITVNYEDSILVDIVGQY